MDGVMVNFVNLTGPQIVGQTLLWACLGGCFWMRLTFELVG